MRSLIALRYTSASAAFLTQLRERPVNRGGFFCELHETLLGADERPLTQICVLLCWHSRRSYSDLG
jgi:hypothetical protein